MEPDNVYVPCDFCTGHGVPLGRLGRLWWYRCRACGLMFAVTVDQYETGG